MKAYSPAPDSAPAPRSRLGLIRERSPFPTTQNDLLAPFFTVRQFTPGEALGLSEAEQEAMVSAVSGLLVYWDEQSPSVICALKARARRRGVPIMALCRADEAEHVAALMIGADGVLPYPVSPVLLQARLRVYQRLVTRPVPSAVPDGDGMGDGALPWLDPVVSSGPAVSTVGVLRLDRAARRFFADGHVVDLTPKEFELMAFMMQHAGVCLSRNILLDQVWGIDYVAETNVLGTQMYALRRKLSAHGLGQAIQTVRGVGYRLAAPAP